MEVRKLFYEDCHLTRFTATVTGCAETEKGWLVTLDATAFYPEGGGQACDLGTLGEARVLDVREREENIVHLCDRPLPVGETVEGSIDYVRRFDLMQQHTGEHILSGLINARYGYHNVGFHVGKSGMEIDFDGPIPSEDLLELELAANRAVWQNLPVRCWYPEEAELPHVGYRTKKALPWPVRIVDVPGYDKCACCGVHVANTGEVGMIKILSCAKLRDGVRLELVCGQRAYDYLNRIFDQNRQISQLLSAKMPDTAVAAKRMADQLQAEKYRSAGLEKQVFRFVAESYVNHGDVLHFEPDLAPVSVRELADTIAERCGGVAAVYSGTDETGYALCLICKNADVKELGNAMAKALDGRGGGKPGSWQGSVKATRAHIEDFWKNK